MNVFFLYFFLILNRIYDQYVFRDMHPNSAKISAWSTDLFNLNPTWKYQGVIRLSSHIYLCRYLETVSLVYQKSLSLARIEHFLSVLNGNIYTSRFGLKYCMKTRCHANIIFNWIDDLPVTKRNLKISICAQQITSIMFISVFVPLFNLFHEYFPMMFWYKQHNLQHT